MTATRKLLDCDIGYDLFLPSIHLGIFKRSLSIARVTVSYKVQKCVFTAIVPVESIIVVTVFGVISM